MQNPALEAIGELIQAIFFSFSVSQNHSIGEKAFQKRTVNSHEVFAVVYKGIHSI